MGKADTHWPPGGPGTDDRAGDTPLPGRAALTPREGDIARLVAAGLHDKEVAARLGISPQTVKNRLMTIRRKLGIASRRGMRDLPELLD